MLPFKSIFFCNKMTFNGWKVLMTFQLTCFTLWEELDDILHLLGTRPVRNEFGFVHLTIIFRTKFDFSSLSRCHLTRLSIFFRPKSKDFSIYFEFQTQRALGWGIELYNCNYFGFMKNLFNIFTLVFLTWKVIKYEKVIN